MTKATKPIFGSTGSDQESASPTAKSATRSGFLGKAFSFSSNQQAVSGTAAPSSGPLSSGPLDFGTAESPTIAAPTLRETVSDDPVLRARLDSRRVAGSIGAASAPAAARPAGQSVIARGCTIRGELLLAGESVIEGTVEGELHSSGTVIVANGGVVTAEIEVEELIVFGQVSGTIQCSKRVELQSGAVVSGKITSPRVVMHDGVRFDGECRMPAQQARHQAGQDAGAEAEQDGDSIDAFQSTGRAATGKALVNE